MQQRHLFSKPNKVIRRETRKGISMRRSGYHGLSETQHVPSLRRRRGHRLRLFLLLLHHHPILLLLSLALAPRPTFSQEAKSPRRRPTARAIGNPRIPPATAPDSEPSLPSAQEATRAETKKRGGGEREGVLRGGEGAGERREEIRGKSHERCAFQRELHCGRRGGSLAPRGDGSTTNRGYSWDWSLRKNKN